ncbi:hypothetical protein GCM10009608_63290 [Pseudonocardia alaniniphila]
MVRIYGTAVPRSRVGWGRSVHADLVDEGTARRDGRRRVGPVDASPPRRAAARTSGPFERIQWTAVPFTEGATAPCRLPGWTAPNLDCSGVGRARSPGGRVTGCAGLSGGCAVRSRVGAVP